MKTRQLSDEERRQHLTYEERVKANKFLMKLWSEAAPYTKKIWDVFGPLAQRSFRIPPGPDGHAVKRAGEFKVGQRWITAGGTGSVIKRIKICGTLLEIFGLVQIDGHDHGLVWLKLGEMDSES